MKYFSIKELCHSDTANSLGIDNSPSPVIVQHLSELILSLLDPLREAWGTPIFVSSGYRSLRLNKALKHASTTSAHLIGYAADLVPQNKKIEEFKKFVPRWLKENNVAFDQCILETDGNGKQWVHLGLYNQRHQQRKQILNLKV